MPTDENPENIKNQLMDEEEYYSLESQARLAFEETYPKEYLEHLAQKSTANQDLVELLWAGFVNGFVARKK